jgi:hypothetical protein
MYSIKLWLVMAQFKVGGLSPGVPKSGGLQPSSPNGSAASAPGYPKSGNMILIAKMKLTENDMN